MTWLPLLAILGLTAIAARVAARMSEERHARTPRPLTPTGPVGSSHPRRWAVLGVLIVSLLVTSIDHTIVNVALPPLALDLQATSTGLWVAAAVAAWATVIAAVHPPRHARTTH